jgi:hypothetical protein
MPLTIIPTCETAVSAVPEWHRAAFEGLGELLHSTEGWSPGALNLAQGLAIKLHAPLLHGEVTRLLIDLARHPDDDARWSKHAMALTPEQREKLDKRHKAPFLAAIAQRVQTAHKREQPPVHISCDTRDLGPATALEFEFDPRRESEADFVSRWETGLRQSLPELAIRHEAAPTRGLGGYLRESFPDLASIRLTANSSAFLVNRPVAWMALKKALIATIPRD